MWFFLRKFFCQDMRPHKFSILKLLNVEKHEHPFVGNDLTEEPDLQSSIKTLLERFRKSDFIDLKLQRGHIHKEKDSFRDEVFKLPDWQIAPWVLQIIPWVLQAFSRHCAFLSKYGVAIVGGGIALSYIGFLGYTVIAGCFCNPPEEVIQLPEQCGEKEQ